MPISFNKPHLTGKELEYLIEAAQSGSLAGDGPFTRRCHSLIEQATESPKALLTHSCTAALEMATILADLGPGDEVIMPSFTFVSTANAVVLRGATPVFVDIREDTFNLDENLIEAAITAHTKAIMPVHYAGVSCNMQRIMEIADRHGLLVIEDAAQAYLSSYQGRPVGCRGHLAALSFHETKNVISGEGGALLINDERLMERAEIIREKGTNRSKFFRGQVDKYTWVDMGSSFLPSELIAAFLYAQLENAHQITQERLDIWARYQLAFEPFEAAGKCRRPQVPADCLHNGHLYGLLLPNLAARSAFISALKAKGVQSVFHYIPLHSSPAGQRYCRTDNALPVTDAVSERLARLPLWVGLTEAQQDEVISAVRSIL